MRLAPMLALALTLVSWASVGAAAQSPAPSPARLVVLPFTLADNGYGGDVARMRALLGTMAGAPERVLADSLAASGRYTIVPAPARDTSAPPCEELACVVRAGRDAGAARVATGRITRISDIIWLVSAALVDVERGRVRHAEESIEVKGDIGDLLPRVMASIARRFVAKDTAAAAYGAGAPAAAAAGAARRPARLTREEVARRLAAASDDAPPALRDADLSGLDLGGLDFHGADLTGCRMVETRLAGARLFGATLSGCTMTGADLTGANLDVAVLRGTDLTRATLRDASIYATILIGANLADAELSGARIIAAAQDARFTRARMVGVRMGADPGNQPMGVMRTDLTGADLAGADLTRADLRKANFTRADLTGATLAGADVAGADFTSAILRSIRGRREILHLDRAANLDRAIGWAP